MPDNFGRMTRDEASPQLTKLLWGDGSITCKVCAERPNCPYVGQVCAMFKPIGQAIRMGTLCDAMKAKEAELAANAKMLARQCDLARQAEIERDGLRARLEAVVEISKSMKLLLILDDVGKWDRAVLLTIRQAIKKVGEG